VGIESQDDRPERVPVDRFLDQILTGDCIEVLGALPEQSVDLIFADPPYNLQLQRELWRPNMTRVDAVQEAWDHFDNFQAYDEFTARWLLACRRVLKATGTLWVIGAYHNIFRIGRIMQDLGFWILNDIIWVKTNPMPNFRGVRFTNAHETLIWASRAKGSRYKFNHHAMKSLNDDLQMRSDWVLPICTGAERMKMGGRKAHPTQKPEALLYRILLASSDPGDIVLDPFFGSGTTGVVARRLHRRWIGIEQDSEYIKIAQQRILQAGVQPDDPQIFDVRDRKRLEPRIPFGALLENNLLQPGECLFFQGDAQRSAQIKADGKLRIDEIEGSIHQVGRQLAGGSPCNGWTQWYYRDAQGQYLPIDLLREKLRKQNSASHDQ
jgi:modification methylase